MMGTPTESRIRWAELDNLADCGVIQGCNLSSNSGTSTPHVLGK